MAAASVEALVLRSCIGCGLPLHPLGLEARRVAADLFRASGRRGETDTWLRGQPAPLMRTALRAPLILSIRLQQGTATDLQAVVEDFRRVAEITGVRVLRNDLLVGRLPDTAQAAVLATAKKESARHVRVEGPVIEGRLCRSEEPGSLHERALRSIQLEHSFEDGCARGS